ncbi:MAG: hypothetical protein PHP50_04290 [Lachnospiraceae bacterium]|nr:hypothetical protein [Lachnospiraceae bacterium]
MNKKGHLLVTGKILPKELSVYSFWIKLGSILPDLFLPTYITGHTWKTSYLKVGKWLQNLQE